MTAPPAGRPAFSRLLGREESTPIERAFADNTSIYCGEEKMKPIIRTIVFIATFVLIGVLIGYVAIKVGEYRLGGEQSASAEYAILRNAVSPITSEQELGDQFVRERLKSLYSASAHLLAVQVLDRNGLVVWKMPDESPYFASPATNPASVFRAPGMSTVIYMTPLPDGMKLMALYAILTQADISKILLVPIIVLAVWILFLIVLQITSKKKSAQEIDTAAYATQSFAPEETETIQTTVSSSEEEVSSMGLQELESAIEEKEEEVSALLHPEEIQPPEEVQPQQEASMPEREPEILPESPVEETPPAHEEFPETEQLEAKYPEQEQEEEGEFVAPQPEPTPKPREFFPATLSLNSLEQALSTELVRNQDLSLMLIHCELAGTSDPSALALGVTIKDYFASETLVYELDEGCYAAILPGSDAGAGLKLAVDLDDVLTATASLYKDLSEEPPFYFGISSRYARAIDPGRLYKEAFAALKHAHEDGSRILAFKPANLTE